MVQTTYINSAPQKSVGLALLLTFFFGPLGMLYSTVVGGLVMLGLDIVLGALTFGLWFIIAWPLQMVWAAVAASESRNTSSTHVAMNYPQQAYMAPAYPQQPMYPQQPTIVQPGLQIPAPPHQTQRAYQDAPTQPPAPGQSTPPEAAWYQAALTPGEIVDAEIVYETQRRYPR